MSLIIKNGEAYGKGGGGDVSGRAKSTAIAPEFNPSESYVIGDKVMHEDEYYVFTADHTGAWDDADVDPTDVDSEIPKAMSDDDLDEIKDVFVPNTGAPLRMMNYSADEQVVGTWIDGRPIYQKTVTVSIPSTSAGSTTERDITTDETFRFIHSEGIAVRSDGSIRNIHSIGIIINSGSSSIPFAYDVLQGSSNKHIFLRYRTTAAQSFTQTVHVTVRYTKTTD